MRMLTATALLMYVGLAPLHAAEKPNVVIIYGDDVGFADLGCYGATKIPTPNLDKLAQQGLRFTDAHCAAATCTPSRYSLLTGEMAFRKPGTGILPGDARMAIDPNQLTLGDTFQKAGYHTGVIGKWHLGLGDGKGKIDWNKAIKPGPLQIGFDECFMMPSTNDRVPCVYFKNDTVMNLDPNDPITVSYGKPLPAIVPGTNYPDAKTDPDAMTYYRSSHGHDNSVINGVGRIGYMKGGRAALWNDEDLADVLMVETKRFIKDNKAKPFFLFYSSHDIHVPRMPNPRFQGKSKLTYRGDAMVQLDWTVGEIMKSLDENGLTDNTIVIFSSDNGPVYDDGYVDGTTVRTSTEEVDRGHDGSGIYKGGKYQIYEGGTRVPLIVRWPGKVEPGVSEALVTQVDFLASFGKMLNVDVPKTEAIDSRDNLNAILGKDKTGSTMILEQARGIALRQGDWKYVEPPKKNKNGGELYNLKDDPSEQTNLIKQHPDRAAKMSEVLEKYRGQGLK